MRFTRPRLRAVSRWTVGLVVAAAALVPATVAQAAVACSVQYKIQSQWSTGFTADVTLKNEGDPLNGWTLGWAFAGDQRVTNGWNGTFTQTGAQVSVRDAGWNGTVPTGGSATAGFQATFSGSNVAPTAFTVNGTACRGPNPAPTVALTSPAPGASYTAPASIPLAATATDDGSVAKVEFYSGSTLIGTDTASPYALAWTAVPVGDYSLTAKAYDNLAAIGTSAPVGVRVIADTGPAIVATPTAVRVPEGGTETVAVKLSSQPAGPVTVTTARTSGDTDLTVATGGSLTFTTANWGTAQNVTLRAAEDADQASGVAVFTASAAGHRAATVDATEAENDTPVYTQRFVELYNRIKDPASGYFSPQGIPYHSVETLIVEAPDYGHVTTSEAFSYLLQLEASYGKVTTDWKPFNDAWALMERYIIPAHADQPTNDAYKPASPATYAPELDLPSQYPAQLDFAAPVGQDPIAGELKSAYGTSDVYGMHWLLDVDNKYGYGRCGDGTTKPSYINTFQRGPQESVWETIPQPSCDTFAHGGRNGFLDLFTGDANYAKQWKYTNAPDADARAVQSAYWALTWAKEQGKASAVSASVANAAKMGDFLRYSFFDKYFKKIGNCVDVRTCANGTGKDSSHYLLSWYYAWGGGLDAAAPWSWRIGDSAAHQGYQNPLAAWALSNVAELKPKSATGAADWATSLNRQLEFYRWLQSSDGGIAGGATNSWDGRYNTPPAGSATFYGMYYDQQPVWHDPPSNQWFGFQAWSMQRVAEYYNVTGDAKAKAVLDKWVPWAIANTTVGANGFTIPDTLQWTGKPDTWNAANPGANAGLRVSVVKSGNDVGIAAALARTLMYYAAKSGNVPAKNTAKALLDNMWTNNQDSRGLAVPETRSDYNRFNDAVSVPAGWTGTMANGDPINSSSTFLSLRSWYKSDPNWSKVDTFLKGGPAPTITYHRFWAQADIATAMADFGRLFP